MRQWQQAILLLRLISQKLAHHAQKAAAPQFPDHCFQGNFQQIFCGIHSGIKESDTGLTAPSQWDIVSDKQMMQEEQPLQVIFFLIL
ncbi:hypothetical protein L195_g048168 [Trifolium pratense]|uniref:Secreted protein n=1 Tax=Trifolium pratense TaxID=57577 RepID=A0A2K3JKI5_TRIPR|nr:hypothetical protein L195_g048168 [Trifolium pratense]